MALDHFSERLRVCVRKSGGLVLLSRRAGVAVRTLSNYLGGKTEPKPSVVIALSKACNLSPEWLLFGIEPLASMASSPADEFAYIPRFEHQPHTRFGAFAEDAQPSQQMAFRREWLSRLGISAESAAILTVQGDSMEPTLRHGDLLLVDLTIREIGSEGMYVLIFDGFAVIKRVLVHHGKITVKSDNPVYPGEEIGLAGWHNLEIAGQVRWFGRTI